MLTLVLIIIAVALLFDFYNGVNDAANSIATIVSTRVLTPTQAVVWAAFWNFVAAFAFGTAVAKAISSDFVNIQVLGTPVQQLFVILAGLCGATMWTYICSELGLPISVSHSLVSGYAGAAVAKAGLAGLLIPGKWPVTIAFIFVSPLLGMIGAAALMVAVAWIFRRCTPTRVDSWFRRLQLLSAAAFSLSHGTNDAQKTMGIIFVAVSVLVSTEGYQHLGHLLRPGWTPPWVELLGTGHNIPWWIILLCHFVIAMGTLMGGWRVVRTMGHNITRLAPVGGFCAESAGAATVIGASIAGIPVSTTHCITGSIMGVGITRGLRAVRWNSGRDIVLAWIFTLPCSGFMPAIASIIIHLTIEPFLL